MKKRIRKTGEIVDVIMYTAPNGTDRNETEDFVDYIDSKGRERRRVPMNYYWDFEDVKEELTKGIDWEEVRIKAAIAFEASMLGGEKWVLPNDARKEDAPLAYANAAIAYTDALIAELKKGGNQ